MLRHALATFVVFLLVAGACGRPDSPPREEPTNPLTITNHPAPVRESYTDFKITPEPGAEETMLRKNAIAFYRAYWTEVLKDKIVVGPKATRNRLRKFAANPDLDMKIKRVNSHIAVIERTGAGPGGFELPSRVEDLWILRSNHWIRLSGFSNSLYKVQFLELNHDAQIDAIVKGGCCGGTGFDIMLGDEEKILRHVQSIGMLGTIRTRFIKPCEGNKILLKPVWATGNTPPRARVLVFDCNRNLFREK